MFFLALLDPPGLPKVFPVLYSPLGTLYVWADLSPLFPEPSNPTPQDTQDIFYGLIDAGVYVPSAQGFHGPQPQFFRILFALPKQVLSVAMDRLVQFAKK